MSQIDYPGVAISNKLLRVPPNAIQAGPIGFDLYARLRGKMVLFCRGGFDVQPRHIEALDRLDLKLYVNKQNWSKFVDYAHESLEEAITDSSVDILERSRLLTDYSRKRIHEILENPAMESVPSTARSIARLYTRLINTSPEAVISLFALSSIDEYNVSHSINTCMLNVLIGGLCIENRPKLLADLGYAGLLHDIGKVNVDQNILRKKGSLSSSEYEAVKMHAVEGEKILKLRKFGSLPVITARSHHERLDGSGYPDGLRGSAIPRCARITAVADVYDALTSRRSYKDEVPPLEAIRVILSTRKQFDSEALNALLRITMRNQELVEKIESGFQNRADQDLEDYLALPRVAAK